VDENFSHCPLWLAEWELSHAPQLPTGWKEWAFWQFSDDGSLTGVTVKDKVDLSHFNGTRYSLRNYILN